MCALLGNKSFRFSVGLVAALAMVLLCNAYLNMLLWSLSRQQSSGSDAIATRPFNNGPSIRSKVDKIKLVSNSTDVMNLKYLKMMLDMSPNKRLPRKPTHALLRAINKLKLELSPKGKTLPDIVDIAHHVSYAIPYIVCAFLMNDLLLLLNRSAVGVSFIIDPVISS